MENNVLTPSDFFEICKRRKWHFVIPAFSIFFIILCIAMGLPRIYRSSATILIEEQEIPRDYVMTSVTSYAEQRLQIINQKIMSSSRLIEIVKKFNPYPKLMGTLTMDEIVSKMRKDIQLTPISAETMDRRTGRPTVLTIAFRLSYEGKNQEAVQRVANVLVSLYLEEHIQVRETQSRETSVFLKDEWDKVKKELAKIDAKISSFKEKHIVSLPQLIQLNLNRLDNLENNIKQAGEKLRGFKEREQYLKTKLDSVPLEAENLEKKRLKELEVQLTYLQTRFSKRHPDVKKAQEEIAELRKVIAKQEAVSRNITKSDNPTHIQMSSKLASVRTDISSVKRQIEELKEEREQYRKRIEATPKVEEEYNLLISQRQNMQNKNDDLMRKYMDAKVAHGLEEGQKGERFTLIDSPRYPEKPYKPNRVAIILIGFALSLFVGIGVVSFLEYTDHSVKNAKMLTMATGFPVLAGVPEIRTHGDISRMRIKNIAVSMGTIIFFLVAIFIVFFISKTFAFSGTLI